MSEGDTTNVRVAVRFRPFNAREKAMNDTDCILVDGSQVTLNANVSGNDNKNFAFDFVFQENCLQSEVWEAIGDPILAKAFSGYNGTIFAYGQTGSGKTWSMQGGSTEELRGIIPRMTASVFAQIDQEKKQNPSMQFLVTASYFELYNEVIFDLLDSSDRRKRPKGGLEIKEHPVLGVYVKNLQEVVIDSSAKMQAMIDQGMANRTTASTQMNAESSRSHSVFTFKLHQKDTEDESKNLFAKVNLVDLAGSERQKSTGAVGATLKEGANINKSLSALGNVINALVEASKGKKGVFIPYRNSKLTRVLQESLGGNSITIMVAAMSRGLSSADETLSTLKYADRAKAIKVKVVKNDESSQISRLNDEIRALKERLMSQGGDSSGASKLEVADVSEMEERHRQQLKDLEEAMKSTWEEKARISEGHEAERLRLEAEQKEATRQLTRQVQEKWQVIEDKKDFDLTISHVKESAKTYRADAVSSVVKWQLRLKDFLKQEVELAEQDTVISVYRTSLEKDEKTLMRLPTSGDSPIRRADSGGSALAAEQGATLMAVDKSSISMWKQMRERFKVLETEATKWMRMQENLLAMISDLKEGISNDMDYLNQRQPETDADRITDQYSEISRGFEIISRQLIEKEMELHSSTAKSRTSLLDFSGTAVRMVSVLEDYDRSLRTVSGDGGVDNTADTGHLVKEIRDSISQVSKFIASSITPDSEDPAASSPSSGSIDEKPAVNELLATLPNGYSLTSSSGELSDTVLALSNVLDWGVLLKKNAPEKLLKRPPVRFIFDVLRTLSETCSLRVTANGSANKCPSWDDVGNSRDTKLQFIKEAIQRICAAVNCQAPVEAESVIAGENSDKVNVFLQYAAVAAFNARENGDVNRPSNGVIAIETEEEKTTGVAKLGEPGAAVLAVLACCASAILLTQEHLVAVKEQVRRKKEESMKKMMDGLADEKRQLEERMVQEKNMMISESLGLSEQLSGCQRKLSETEGLLSAESNMRQQMQELVQRTEQEKGELQEQLQTQLEENDALRTAHLAMQTKYQKDIVLLENFRKKIDEQDKQINHWQCECEKYEATFNAAESDKEELVNQVSVLTEERDSARNNEEGLFDTLRERENDLEKLQESYVDMTDRCNDYQDELSDLREKVESLEELLRSARTVAQPVVLSSSRSEAVISHVRSSETGSVAHSTDERDRASRASFTTTPIATVQPDLLTSSDDCGLGGSPSAQRVATSACAPQPAESPPPEVRDEDQVIVEEKEYCDDNEFEDDDYGDDFND